MTTIKSLLLGDGSSDRMLIGPLTWMLDRVFPDATTSIDYADLRRLAVPDTRLETRLRITREQYNFDLLFIHRDAERLAHQDRVDEVSQQIQPADFSSSAIVVPVRMTEAWLLHDEQAIREAAGNPNGRVSLNLPAASRVHELADPKDTLSYVLTIASELSKRRRRRFRPHERMHRVAELINDYSPLIAQPSFAHVLEQLHQFQSTR